MATVVTGYVPTAEGDAALAAAIQEARRRGARLVVAHTPPDGDLDVAASVAEVLGEAGIEHELRSMDSGQEASEELIDLAEELDAELLVIGLRRRSPVGKLILGTNAQRVLLDAPCPVLTVKPASARR